jgi:PIN domain nuclease of toxin-antitoxin system
MRLLLDSHVFYWAIAKPDRLSATAREALQKASSLVVSVVTPWELATKAASGKFAEWPLIDLELRHGGYEMLAVTAEHVRIYVGLPLHHRDPFDRMLIAQAVSEDLPIMTADAVFASYPVSILKAG